MCTCENDYLMAQAFSFLSRSSLLDTKKIIIGNEVLGKE
jgi:hypothetical protein